MRGAITGKDVIVNSLSIVRLWGVATWFSCVWAAIARKQTTFLDVLYPAPLPTPASDAAPPSWRHTR
jgi:hypothetical protein